MTKLKFLEDQEAKLENLFEDFEDKHISDILGCACCCPASCHLRFKFENGKEFILEPKENSEKYVSIEFSNFLDIREHIGGRINSLTFEDNNTEQGIYKLNTSKGISEFSFNRVK